MQTENLSPTPYDAELAETIQQVKDVQEALMSLQAKARQLAFSAVQNILDVYENETADFRFPSGDQSQYWLSGSDIWGNAIFTALVTKGNYMDTKCVFLDMLRDGSYDGVTNPIITKAIV